jgi:branched-chain amino acid aminotransferase
VSPVSFAPINSATHFTDTGFSNFMIPVILGQKYKLKLCINYVLLFNTAILSMVMSFINLNGKLTSAADTQPPHDNRAFRYGYGLFETMLFRDGHIELKQYHWERLFAGMRQLQLEVPDLISYEWLEEETIKTVEKNKLEKLCRVRLQIYAEGGGLYDAKSQKPGFIIECFPLEPSSLQLNENGLVTGIASGLLKSMDALANLKTCNALIYAMAARQAAAEKWNDAFICNTNNNIIESAISNVFWTKNGELFTPPLSEGCIAGVMRRNVITKLAEKNIHVYEKPLSAEAALNADEIFLTNTIKRIRWVRALAEKDDYKCKVVREIQTLLL